MTEFTITPLKLVNDCYVEDDLGLAPGDTEDQAVLAAFIERFCSIKDVLVERAGVRALSQAYVSNEDSSLAFLTGDQLAPA